MKLLGFQWDQELTWELANVLNELQEMQTFLAYTVIPGNAPPADLVDIVRTVRADLHAAMHRYAHWWTRTLLRFKDDGKSFPLTWLDKDVAGKYFVASYEAAIGFAQRKGPLFANGPAIVDAGSVLVKTDDVEHAAELLAGDDEIVGPAPEGSF